MITNLKSKFPLDSEYQRLRDDSVKKNRKRLKFSQAAFVFFTFLCAAVASIGIYFLYLSFYWNPSSKNHPNPDVAQCSIEENNRFDCWPEVKGASEELCVSRGCCWQPSSQPNTSPYCFYPSNYNGYNASEVKETDTGLETILTRKSSSVYSPDVKVLKLIVDFQTDSRLRIKIFDPNTSRYEVPLAVPASTTRASKPLYSVAIGREPFNIMVSRKSTGEIIFDTSSVAPLVFSDQYLQIATKMSTKYLYGLGEHRNDFLVDVSKWGRYVFWNRDDVPKTNNNGYGSHPFFMNLEQSKDANTTGSQNNAHGVFLLNSNAGEVAFQPFGDSKHGAITYRFLGGVLDFFIFLGPEPERVTQQLVDVIGHPYFPPFWSLGYQLCRWGYNTSANLSKVIARNREAHMPYDVQWTDIDYMDANRDWTYDTNKFKGLPEVIADLHQNHQRYVLMADPAISSSSPAGTYPPFDDGKKMDVFIKNSKGEILSGRVWPGETAFPDFFHPNAEDYWYKQVKDFHDKISFDGLWIDMNEPSNFVDGSTEGCPQSKYNNPPYVPPGVDSGSLIVKTICLTAQQNISIHYNVHNMYGWSQANVSRRVLNRLYQGKRSPLISRSTFPGSAVNTGHWLGDNFASYDDMYYSIPGILNFNMFGLPQVGVDICGFRGATTNELCTRWTQLAVFYPFMRNHADFTSPDQDPASFPSPYKDYMRSALQLRYSLLAVLYTHFYQAHVSGLPIIRPLMFYYKGTEGIDRQFLMGDELLVSPVLTQGDVTVTAFLPSGRWYDFYNGSLILGAGQFVQLDAPLDRINIHIRGGAALPLLPPTERTDLSRKEKFEVVCAPDSQGNAVGHLFWDDGQSLDNVSNKNYTEVEFSLQNGSSFTSHATFDGYHPAEGLRLGKIRILHVSAMPKQAQLNGKAVTFSYSATTKVLSLTNLAEDLTQPIRASWQ